MTALPATTTPDIGAFAEGLARGEVLFCECRRCGARLPLAPLACRHCSSESLIWRKSSGIGRVYAVTEVHRAPSPAFRDLVPYLIILVDLEDGVRVMAHGEPGLRIDDRVSASTIIHDGQILPMFLKAEPSA
jgi:uncharacterized OB-fold protein